MPKKTVTKTLVGKPSCPKCSSLQVLYSVRKKASRCRVCGHEFKKAAEVKRVLAG